MMLIRIIIMLLIALFVESRQDRFICDRISWRDMAESGTLLLLYSVYMDKAGRKWSLS